MPIDMDKFRLTCERLVTSAMTLNEVTEDLNKMVRKVEKSLKNLNLGVRVGVPMKENQELWYTKGAEGWGLYIVTTSKSNFGEGKWPFCASPRPLRITSIDFIPNLVQAMADEGNKIAEDMEAATIRARQMMAGILEEQEGDK